KLEETQIPKWLTKIQNNSWEPEIIISGFSIAFFFILPKYIYNFTAMLIQDFGADALLSFVQYTIMIFIITSLKVLFIGHLTLRGLWTGLVGLSYVFPNGVKKELLEKELKNLTFKKPIALVIEIEKICSLIFSFAFMIILYLIKIMMFYFVLIAGNIIFYAFNLNSAAMQFAQLTLIAIVIVIFVIFQTFKKKMFWEHTSNSVSSNLIHTFSTNISKKRMRLILLSFIIITIPLSYSSISKFKFDVQRKLRISKSNLTYVDQNNYLNEKNNGLRIPRAAINSFLIENSLLELYISSYKRDEGLIRDIQANFDKYKIVMPKVPGVPEVDINKLDQTGLYQIFVDDELILVKDWLLKKGVDNSQKFLTAEIPVDNISSGIHTLKINRVRWRKKDKDFVIIKDWASIPFKM
ncbi:MAG: hypothetical protein P9L97_13440, partial [Candidatus Tenebribacter davisii]|nr:hypothetical protein [Candidatus Tenebribacter davisii]